MKRVLRKASNGKLTNCDLINENLLILDADVVEIKDGKKAKELNNLINYRIGDKKKIKKIKIF